MKRGLYFVPVVLLFASLPASAATVEAVRGKVLINRGEGFQQAASGAQANAGDLVMASAGASAKVVYEGGCQVRSSRGGWSASARAALHSTIFWCGAKSTTVGTAIHSYPLVSPPRSDGVSSVRQPTAATKVEEEDGGVALTNK